MSPRITIALLLLLAACATPQQRCINSVTRDLQVVSDLITQSEINLARGYGTVQQTTIVPTVQPCGGNIPVQQPNGAVQWVYVPQNCWVDEAVTTTRPVAIDLDAEKQKLAQLRKQQARLNKQAAPAVAQCKALYPQ